MQPRVCEWYFVGQVTAPAVLADTVPYKSATNRVDKNGGLMIDPTFDELVKKTASLKMKHILTVLIFVSFIGISHSLTAMDDASSLQCDGGLVFTGDSAASVKEKCGPPQKILSSDIEGPVVWIYDFGDSKFIYHVNIVNNAVERIEMGPRGEDLGR